MGGLIVNRVDVVVGINHGFDHRRSRRRQRRLDRGLERVGTVGGARRHAEIMRRRLAVGFGLQLGAVERNWRRICFILMSASQRSSSTTIGSAMLSRLAVATSPHVIWKQPSPNKHTTGRSGRASFAAIAPGSPKPMDDQPLVMWKVLGA